MNTVLVIDDEVVSRSVVAHFFRANGWDIIEAEDGEVGIRLARERHPDLVVCDLLMPRGNGFEVCRTLRGTAGFAQVRIVVTSGRVYEADRQGALRAGADEYLLKPLTVEVLRDLMQRALRHAGTGSPGNVVEFEGGSGGAARLLRFWGVRGSVPTPGPDTIVYGGNTSCVEVRADGEIIILDAGTGIRPLGLALAREFGERPMDLTLLISHTHWDHIQGFPFFLPAYQARNRVRILGYEGSRSGLAATLGSQMESPYFPIGLDDLPGNIVIEEVRDLEFSVGRVQVRGKFVNHPGMCLGYRLDTSVGSVVYLPDNEPFNRQRLAVDRDRAEAAAYVDSQAEALVAFVRGAEVLIMDAQYDAEGYRQHAGWGHGCTEDAVEVALRSGVRQLFLFHHDPASSDEKIRTEVAHGQELARRAGAGLKVEAAREGAAYLLAADAAPVACAT
jgi:phosphoribosyl 1,2-cyclic phosphodiesterase/CheY-like chemotaxis protein